MSTLMKIAPLLIVNLLYLGQAAIALVEGNFAGAAILLGYTVANCGLIATMI